MKILFICGSLEPGKDGVGDYSTRLAVQLILQGHVASILALNDMFLISDIEEVLQVKGVQLPVLRLPSVCSLKIRFNKAEKYIQNFNPDWLSLQFVPFSFHPKGLPFGLAVKLKRIAKERLWHIMFHELWVGMDKRANYKLRIWGKVQKRLIKSFTKRIKPSLVHTQTKLYQFQLSKIGIYSKYLPLFSNIPVFQNISVNVISSVVSCKISLVLFGGIHYEAPVEKFAREISAYCQENDIHICLKIIGRSGLEQERWAESWKAEGLDVQILGEQSSENISRILNTCTYGISTTPISLAEKSGTIAAMLEHGLPVLCVRDSWSVNGASHFAHLSGVMEYKEGILKLFFENKGKAKAITSVDSIGNNFVNDLLQVANLE